MYSRLFALAPPIKIGPKFLAAFIRSRDGDRSPQVDLIRSFDQRWHFKRSKIKKKDYSLLKVS
jgi:hypothetical protein